MEHAGTFSTSLVLRVNRHPCEGFKETRSEYNYNLRKGE